MEHSKETIERIKKFIRVKEKDFLITKNLVPITQTECAAHVGVNVSTICRILTSDIKIKFGQNEYPLSYFFSQRRIHPQVFNEWVNQVIKREDPSKPLSDRRLLIRFKKEFPETKLSLRTIRKYRMKAGIESSSGRRGAKFTRWLTETIEKEDPKDPLTDKMLVEKFKVEYPESSINEIEIAKFRRRAGLKGYYQRRSK
jgi:DNA-directed RNA polymerase specialized sigma54-like protein